MPVVPTPRSTAGNKVTGLSSADTGASLTAGARIVSVALVARGIGGWAVRWLTDQPALGWLALALAFGVAELLTVNLVFVMLAGGALAGAAVAGVGAGVSWQVVTAVVVALLLLGVVRPVVVRRARVGDPTLTGTAALVGREALVVETVSPTGGRIKLAGEVWSARTESQADPDALLPGRSVRVLTVEGATAVVVPTGPELEIS